MNSMFQSLFKKCKYLSRLNNKSKTSLLKPIFLSLSSSSSPPSSSLDKNLLNANKSKRLMRLVYARLHPDLFTNYLQAQKQNENSLKSLRNLIDSYSNENNKHNFNRFLLNANDNSQLENELVFYLKVQDESNQLKKIKIKNLKANSIQNRVEHVLNQLIEHLELPVSKFMISNQDCSSERTNNSFNPRNYDIDFEWYSSHSRSKNEHFYENENNNKTPSLESWLNQNKSQIKNNMDQAQLAIKELNVNKQALIKNWKLKNILIESNWSMKNFNSYLQALNSTNVSPENEFFKGYTLVLTNSNYPGLRKNGQIYLSCDQVYEEWLNVLTVSKQNEKLLNEIKEMENNLSILLRQINICDNLSESVDTSLMQVASYYHKCLNVLLNNLTSHLITSESIDSSLFGLKEFSNLQLTIQDVNKHELNETGQFVIGVSEYFTYENTVQFIKSNQLKSIKLYSDYVKNLGEIRKLQERVEITTKLNLSFVMGLNNKQKIECLQKFDDLSKDVKKKKMFESIKTVNVGNHYFVNDDGSIQIPWNWFSY